MSRRGPKPGYLTLMAAAEIADAGEYCGAMTSSGKACQRPAGWGTGQLGQGACRDHATGARSTPCPLPLTKLEERVWNDISMRMRELGLLKAVFWPTMYGLVVALALLHEADRSIDSLVVPGRRGLKRHPSTTVVSQMLAHVRSYCAELGLTPSALAKVGVPRASKPSKMGRLIRGRPTKVHDRPRP